MDSVPLDGRRGDFPRGNSDQQLFLFEKRKENTDPVSAIQSFHIISLSCPVMDSSRSVIGFFTG